MVTVKDPSWLGALIEGPGEDVRCSPHEDSEYNVPSRVEPSTELPGGHGPATIVIPRPEGEDGFFALDRVRQWMGAPVMIFDEDNRNVHESRITGDSQIGPSEIELETEGFSKSLEDDETARLLGIDRNLANWEERSTQRQLNLLALPRGLDSHSLNPDDTTGAPSIETGFEGSWTTLPNAEAWYDAQRLNIAHIDYAWKRGTGVGSGGTNHSWAAFLSDDDILTTSDTTGDLEAAGPGSGTLNATSVAKKWAMVQHTFAAAGGTSGTRYSVFWPQLAVIGDHGIPLIGTVGTGINDIRGLLVSDIVEYIVQRWGTLLKFNSSLIELTSFAVPQVVFLEDTTALEMIESLVLFGGNTFLPLDWGVYDNREPWMATPGNYGRVWETRLDEGAEPVDSGNDVKERLNGVKMTYDDGTGSELSVGPPGSGATLETTAVQDLTPSNPVNAAKGIDRRWQSATMGVTSAPGAQLAAQNLLADANRKQWRGDIDIKGFVREKGGVEEPAYMMRAGDRGVVGDDPDIAERRIINTRWDPEKRVNTVSIGAQPNRQETLYARAGIVLEGFLS